MVCLSLETVHVSILSFYSLMHGLLGKILGIFAPARRNKCPEYNETVLFVALDFGSYLLTSSGLGQFRLYTSFKSERAPPPQTQHLNTGGGAAEGGEWGQARPREPDSRRRLGGWTSGSRLPCGPA